MTSMTSPRRLHVATLIFAGVLSLPSHAEQASPVTRTTVEGLLNATGTCPPNWSYDGKSNGPAQWATMPNGYPACSGSTQSPIDIRKFADQSGSAIVFDYSAAPLSVFNTGAGLQVSSDAFGTANLPNGPWTLKQFHFHFPSEHHYKGKSFPGEVHLVHQNAAGELAVIAAFITHGAENGTLALVANAEPTACNTLTSTEVIDPSGLLPQRQDYFQYGGSLTTPPCSEGVSWYVMHHPIEASKAQIAALAAGMNNARPLQHNANPVTYERIP